MERTSRTELGVWQGSVLEGLACLEASHLRLQLSGVQGQMGLCPHKTQ